MVAYAVPALGVVSGRAPAAGLSSRPSDLRLRNLSPGRRGARSSGRGACLRGEPGAGSLCTDALWRASGPGKARVCRCRQAGARPGAGALTAGHRTLPFGTKVEVVNLRNGRAVTVKITDRGPYTRGRVIDLSRAAARAIGMTGIDEVALYAGPQAPEVTATGSVAGRPRPR